MYALFKDGVLIDAAEQQSSLWALADDMGITTYGRSCTHIEGLKIGYEIREIKESKDVE